MQQTFSWINQIYGEVWTKQTISIPVARILFKVTRNFVNLNRIQSEFMVYIWSGLWLIRSNIFPVKFTLSNY